MCEKKQIEEISEILSDAAHKACEDIPFAPANLEAPCPITSAECHHCKEARALIAQGYIRKTENTVEVVRCKDCRDYEEHGNGKAGICKNKKCKGLRYAVDFCSYGTRREE